MRFNKLEDFLRTPIGRGLMGIGSGSADFANLVRESEKFFMGDLDGSLRMIKRFGDEWVHLPFALCLFEMRNVDGNGDDRSAFILADENDDGMSVHSFIPAPRSLVEAPWLHTGWIDVHKASGTFDVFLNKNTVEIVQDVADTNALQASLETTHAWLWTILEVINCVNVRTEIVTTSAALNKKRAKSGKPPLYSYRTLVLRPSPAQRVQGGGTHDSPRIHLRRGHVKRRKTGNFWWQPHAVGDRSRGVVMKDYDASNIGVPQVQGVRQDAS